MTRSRESFGRPLLDRPIAAAAAASLLWHLFWFFSVTIVVSPREAARPRALRVVSLGPVLNDDIFRTLVESRVEATPAFYRPRLSGGTATELPAESAVRRAPGDVVSVPFGQKAQDALAGLLAGRKASPDFDVLDAFGSLDRPGRPSVRFEGPAGERQALFSPPKPALPAGADPAALHSATRIRFSVDASGAVASAQIAASSGYPEIDLLWLEYLRRFQFVPQGPASDSEASEAVLTFGGGS